MGCLARHQVSGQRDFPMEEAVRREEAFVRNLTIAASRAARSVAERGNVDIVLDDLQLLYLHPRLNITADVTRQLDARGRTN